MTLDEFRAATATLPGESILLVLGDAREEVDAIESLTSGEPLYDPDFDDNPPTCIWLSLER